MKLGLVLHDLHHHENRLAHHLLRVAERHGADHEIHQLGQDLAAWSHRHIRELAHVATRYGLDLDPGPGRRSALLDRLQERAGELGAGRDHAELVLLYDLRQICTDATGVRLDWDMVVQGAQAAKDAELLALARSCVRETERQIHWAEGKLKESAPQILAT
ncbi:hypothetical protein [Streptomyces sp. NPDC002889]|uniref:hypothetical protein n=1 Tax=Streptomyces sp. NPDC002889 TaxID=3364669 RepID=UPI0036AF5FA8